MGPKGAKSARGLDRNTINHTLLMYREPDCNYPLSSILFLLYIYHALLSSQAPFAVKKKSITAFFECMSGDFTGFATAESLGASDRTSQLQPCISLCTSPQRGRSSKLLKLVQSY